MSKDIPAEASVVATNQKDNSMNIGRISFILSPVSILSSHNRVHLGYLSYSSLISSSIVHCNDSYVDMIPS